tara:strand:- start:299 stop:553 length:255 start_codon:yes stop_codon:yes gene_type:complete
MQVDFKITTWERVEVEEDSIEEVQKAIESGAVTSAEQLVSEFNGVSFTGTVDETDEQLTVEENGGCSTIEILASDGETIWENGK